MKNSDEPTDKTPVHIGYILDGNRRWAKQHGLPTYEGHMAGYEALKDVIDATAKAGVKYISLYAFSIENWNRTSDEISRYMNLIRRFFSSDLNRLIEKGYKVVVLGVEDKLDADIVRIMREVQEKSQHNTGTVLAVCFNYSGQNEIARAAKRIVEAGVDAPDVTPELFEDYLDHPEVPACDLIVRTSGEQRLSNFMLWRSAYSEFIFLDKYWPDMRPEDVTDILKEYNKRNRRLGG